MLIAHNKKTCSSDLFHLSDSDVLLLVFYYCTIMIYSEENSNAVIVA